MGSPFLSLVMYKRVELALFATRTYGYSARAEQQRDQQDQAAGIYAQAEIFEFSAAATEKQYYEQNPRAVATAKGHSAAAAAVAVSVAFAVAAFVKHSVEHFVPPFAVISAFVFD